MANHKQSKKRIRQTIKRNDRNRGLRSKTRNSIIQLGKAIDAGEKEQAATALKIAVHNLDKSVTKKVMKRTTASRTISRLTKRVNKI